MSMDFTMKTSLVDSASIAVITGIWYKEKVIGELLNENEPMNRKIENSWQDSEDNVVKRLNQLPIPKTSKFLLIDLAQPIGRELKKWLEFHKYLDLTQINLDKVLVWNTPGIINSKQTAEKIIANDFLCPLNRFRLACVNCIESEIHLLWPPMRFYFFDSNDNSVNLIDTTEVMFWICYLENKVEELMELIEYDEDNDIMRFAFWAAVENNNDVAARHFSKKIELQDLCRIVKTSLNFNIKTHLNCNPSLLVFLLAYLSKSDQNELFHGQSENVLRHFLNWPLQFFFLDLANKLWCSLSTIAYYNVMEEIVRKVSENHWGQTYFQIFTGFWKMAPLRYKSYVIHKCINATFLSRIFALKETDGIIGFILKEMSKEERLKMLFEFNGMLVIDYLASKGRRKSLTLFINSCATTEDDVERLRKLYFEHMGLCSYLLITDEHRQFFCDVLENVSKMCLG